MGYRQGGKYRGNTGGEQLKIKIFWKSYENLLLYNLLKMHTLPNTHTDTRTHKHRHTHTLTQRD